MDYESSLPKKFDFPLAAICRYSLDDLISYGDGSLLPELIKIHSHTITSTFAGEVNFQAYYLQSVVESLNRILPKTVSSLFLDYLEMRCQLPRNEIPNKMEEFEKELGKFFGPSGSIIMSKHILKNLYSKIGLKAFFLDRGIPSYFMLR